MKDAKPMVGAGSPTMDVEHRQAFVKDVQPTPGLPLEVVWQRLHMLKIARVTKKIRLPRRLQIMSPVVDVNQDIINQGWNLRVWAQILHVTFVQLTHIHQQVMHAQHAQIVLLSARL